MDLRTQGLPVGGVASPRVLVAGKTVGYRVRDLATGEERPLCSVEPPGIPFRRFFFSPEGLASANAALARAVRTAEVIVADEVGPLELIGGGFTPGIRAALGSPAFLVFTVRPSLVDEVRAWASVAAPAIALDSPPGQPRGPDATRALFDRIAADHDRWTDGAGPLAGSRASLARAAALVRPQPGERLLDIGIGTGAFAAQVAQAGTEVWGVDPSPRMLARCRAAHPDYHLREGHFLQLPVPDAAFDIVVSSFAFHHLAPVEYDDAFREIGRVLSPGGQFLLLDIMFASEADREAARAALGELWDDEETYPLVPTVERAARQAGACDVVAHRVSELHWVVTGTKPRGRDQRTGGRPWAAGVVGGILPV